jgi:amino acid adenylation domain-containing protein
MVHLVKLELADKCELQLSDAAKRLNCDAHALLGSVFAAILFRFGGEDNVSFGFRQNKQHTKLAELVMALDENFLQLVEQIQAISVPSSGVAIASNIPSLFITEGSYDTCISDCTSDLALVIQINAEYIENVAIFYSPDTHSAFLASQMLDSWATVIKTIATLTDSSRLKDLGLLSLTQSEMLDSWNRTSVAFPRNECLHDFFEAQVEINGGGCAVFDPDGSPVQVSYSELNRRANQLANLIGKIGGSLPANTLVGVYLPRSGTVYMSFLAIMKAGCAYVALDPAYPAERVEYILSDSSAPVLITTQELAKNITIGAGTKVICIDTPAVIAQLKEQEETQPATRRSLPADLCYVIYTSGSTGRPKGVKIHHGAACNFVRAEALFYELSAKDRILQGFSTCFDASVEEIWMAFFVGATLVVGSNDLMHSGPDFPKRLTDLRITALSTVPSLLSVTEGDMPTVKLLIVGGEACSRDVVARWAPGRKFFNTYGPTEATVVATYAQLHADVTKIHIGKPLANCRVYILDDSMNILPPGATGNMWLAGLGVSNSGYVNKPEETAKRFKSDLKGSVESDGTLMYDTGDIARYITDGDIEYLGRADGQVKLRGYRIELSEIEEVLCESALVQAAVVDIREDELFAWCVRSDAAAGESDGTVLKRVLDEARKKLATYMIPSAIFPANALPRLPGSMKVAKKLLKIPDDHGTTDEKFDLGALLATLSDDETKIYTVFEAVLGAGKIAEKTDSFFDAGGHSLLVSKCITRLREEFPWVSARDVYANPSVQSLTEAILALKTLGAHANTPEADAEREAQRVRLSWTQYFMADIFQFVSLYLLVLTGLLHSYGVLMLTVGASTIATNLPLPIALICTMHFLYRRCTYRRVSTSGRLVCCTS